MKKIFIISLLAIVFCGCLVCCSYSRSDLEQDLNSIQNANDESEIFKKIWDKSRINMTSYDKSGKKISFSEKDFPNIVSIHFHQFGDPPIQYKIKNIKNLFVLMRE